MPYIIRNGKIIKVGAAKKRTVKRRVVKRRAAPKQKRVVSKTWKEKRHNWFVSKKTQYRVHSRDALARAMARDPDASPREKRWANKVISGERSYSGHRRTQRSSDPHLQRLYESLRNAQNKLSMAYDPQEQASLRSIISGIKSAIWEYRGESRLINPRRRR
jgi:hypothetical protein